MISSCDSINKISTNIEQEWENIDLYQMIREFVEKMLEIKYQAVLIYSQYLTTKDVRIFSCFFEIILYKYISWCKKQKYNIFAAIFCTILTLIPFRNLIYFLNLEKCF